MFYNKQNQLWFTLIEIMVWIVIFSIVMVWWFQALFAINIWKVRLMSNVDSQKQIIYFGEKLFEEIKKWWLIDYEEYFNRKVVWTTFSSGHYDKNTWFWNFWNWWDPWDEWDSLPVPFWAWFYQCISWDLSSGWTKMTWSWCFDNMLNTDNFDFTWVPQRYGQYSFQFIDYNSNYDDDGWDEDWVNWIMWDDDDEYLWDWPVAFTWWINQKELYLISWDKKNRTLFRWNVKLDPKAPDSATCTLDSNNIITWSWCLWTIEFLKLEWKDYWLDHESWTGLEWEYDWVIDTWLIDKDFSWWAEIVAWTGSTNYRVPLFPDSINVSDFKVFVYPNKDFDLSWKSKDVNLSPYVRLSLTFWPSWDTKRKIKWKSNDVNFSTTISLTDIFSK